MFKKYMTRAVALGSAVVASASHAAIDVAAVTGQITSDGTTAISAIGVAMLTLAGIAVVFKWSKASVFG
ncbi:major capsid protein [Vibrio tarriae]|uniref:major capsid protein n=1 Tax=Vibrio tarriae TaxID=2014742 RepID=UPI000DE568AB|nr:major capsid protein [Vibrio tarriae]RBM38903.1 hypothetical protein DLR63_09310 [Vibrio tarriae]